LRKLLVIFSVFLYVFKGYPQDIDKSLKYEMKILERLVIDITGKKYPKVFFDGVGENKIRMIIRFTTIKMVNNISKADFVFIKNKTRKYNAIKPTIALDFASVKNCDFCIGVFSWRNGRPILILFKENLQKFDIVLPKEYKYYIESKKYIVGKK